MKGKKIKSVIPLLFLALGIFTALSVRAKEKTAALAGSAQGYKRISGLCVPTGILCDEVPAFLCKAPDGAQLYGLAAANTCPILLFRSTP